MLKRLASSHHFGMKTVYLRVCVALCAGSVRFRLCVRLKSERGGRKEGENDEERKEMGWDGKRELRENMLFPK